MLARRGVSVVVARARDGISVCIVGAGPGGFYAAKYILKELPTARVCVVDAMPVPFGTPLHLSLTRRAMRMRTHSAAACGTLAHVAVVGCWMLVRRPCALRRGA
jgi:hypothetical protein